MQHPAIYYDGQTSQPHQAQVEIFGNKMRINIEGTSVIWAIPETTFSTFMGMGKTMLQYGEFPHQYLEFPADSALAQAINGYLPPQTSRLGNATGQYQGFIKALLIMAGITIVVLLMLYYLLMPVMVSWIIGKIPVSAEIAMGEKFFQGFMGDASVNKKATIALNRFARQINFETSYPLRFTVVENTEVNAFALPGGHVVVYSGIIGKIKTPEEMAALLAHEVTHVKDRHSLHALTRSMAASVLLSFIFGDDGTLSSVLINKADEIHQLGFSRRMEKEADLEGLKIMVRNNVDTRGMLRLMQRLQTEETTRGNGRLPAYLSSHPLTEERIAYITEHSPVGVQTRNKALVDAWKQIK